MNTYGSIKIDVKEVQGRIDRNIYGHFIENMARCIYNGLVPDRVSKVPVTDYGVRIDVLEKIKALKPPIIRWPGGLHADGYHWKNGIGSLTSRSKKVNRYWFKLGPRFGIIEPNRFGTDEFLKFCQDVKADPYININFGSGRSEEARQWVEYVNGTINTPNGRLRKEHGHPEPYNVKYWGIGNEIYGWWAIGHTSAKKYAERYIEFCRAMRSVDPNLKFIAVGTEDIYPKWNSELLKIAGDFIDYLSVHIYLPGNTPRGLFLNIGDKVEDYYSIVSAPLEIERKIKWVEQSIVETLGKNHNIAIALDEWNLWWNFWHVLRPKFTLRDAISISGVLNVLNRMSHIVKMANIAQLVNVLGLINTNKDDVYLSPLYLAFKLYIDNVENILVNSNVISDSFGCEKLGGIPKINNIPFIDCSATINEARNRLSLIIVNRHHNNDIKIQIDLKNFKPGINADICELNGFSYISRNDFENKEEVRLTQKKLSGISTQFEYTLPKHSVTALKFISAG